jgi:hypothetical protein
MYIAATTTTTAEATTSSCSYTFCEVRESRREFGVGDTVTAAIIAIAPLKERERNADYI